MGIPGKHVRAARSEFGVLETSVLEQHEANGPAEYVASEFPKAREPRWQRNTTLTSSDCMVSAVQLQSLARSREQPCFFRKITSGEPNLTYRESVDFSALPSAPWRRNSGVRSVTALSHRLGLVPGLPLGTQTGLAAP